MAQLAKLLVLACYMICHKHAFLFTALFVMSVIIHCMKV